MTLFSQAAGSFLRGQAIATGIEPGKDFNGI
jgi:hypothetical protein